MHVIDVMAMMTENVIGLRCNACARREGDGDAHCNRIEAVMHVIDVMAIVMEIIEIVIGSKLYYM